MKRSFLLVSLLVLSVFMLFAGEYDVEFVSFSVPNDFEDSLNMFESGMGFKRGELDPSTNEVGEGVYFAIGISDDIGDDMIADMKSDEDTFDIEESYSTVNGYSVEIYSGNLAIEGVPIWFKAVYFPLDEIEETQKELVFLAMVNLEDHTDVEVELNTILNSIQIDAASVSLFEEAEQGDLYFNDDGYGVYEPGEMISMGFYIPEIYLNNSPWMGIVPSDVEHGSESINDQYDSDHVYLYDSAGVVSMAAPSEPGFYDFRMNDSDYDGTEIAYMSFEVVAEEKVASDAYVYINYYEVEVGSYVPVYFGGLLGGEYDWIGVFPEGADDYGYESFGYTDSMEEGEYDLYMPEVPGFYTIRAFNGDTEEMIAETELFEIIAMEEPETVDPVNLSLEPLVVYPGDEITCYFSEAPGNDTDWVGIYEEADVDDYIVDWMYTDGSETGYVIFNAPTEPGNYVFRFMPNDTFDSAGESEPFAVLDVETSEVTNPDEKILVTTAVFCEIVEEELPVNEKTEFSYSEEFVYFWLELGTFKDAHEVVWEWVYPDGTIYDTVYLDVPSATSSGKDVWDSLSLWSWIPAKEETEKQPGIWKVNFYIDDELVLVKQFNMKKAEFTKKPAFLRKNKKIEIGNLELSVPVEAEIYDETGGTEVYVTLNPEDDEYAFIGFVFSNEDLIYENGEAYTYSTDEFMAEGWNYLQYDEESDMTDNVIDLMITDQYDSEGRNIYIYLMSPEDQFDGWEEKFLEILDSIEINN